MMTNALSVKTATYQQLTDTLTQLGFQRRVTPQFTAYRNAPLGALIVLPQDDTPGGWVRPLHLAAARATVVGKGAATAAEFDRLLLQVGGHVPAGGGVAGHVPAGVSITGHVPAGGSPLEDARAASAKKRTKKVVAAPVASPAHDE